MIDLLDLYDTINLRYYKNNLKNRSWRYDEELEKSDHFSALRGDAAG